MLELGTKFLISYFLGSIMGAIVIGKLRGGVDIREMGSGNAGGTNALRTQGAAFALGVIIIDIGKGVLAASVVPYLDIPFVATDPDVSRVWLALCCAAAAVLGHVWPVYHGFRGGKGMATYIGTLLVLAPKLIVPMLIVFAVALVISGFVGLSTMTASASLPVTLAVTGGSIELIVFSTFMAAFIVYCHRSNIQRMRDGVENRNERAMLFRRKG
ncbi:MAG: glycerol-3-phosphate 1-O-acyltransferase PlsY [Woeseiaceae bacterium]|nr:glycerol-3-phosphate 1-O-acyltransferase PlsY [Woeseiaceae bacterium]